MGWRRNSVLFVIAACSSGVTAADAARLSYDITGVMQWEDDLFRLPKAAADLLPHDGTDRIAVLKGSVAIDGGSGDVSFGGSASAQKSWFANNDYLDNVGYAMKVHAKYAGQRSSVAIDGGFLRRLTSFEDIRGTDRNFQTLATASAEATQEIGADIRAVGRADFVRSTNSLDPVALNDYRRIGAAAGLGYYSPAGNILSVEATVVRSTGLNDVSSGGFVYRSSYIEKSIVARLYWQPSMIWQIDARVGYTWHDDQSLIALDFSGLTGDASVTWSPRRAILIGLRAARRYESDSAVFSNGIRDSEITGWVTANATDRLTIRINLRRSWRLFRYDSQSVAPLLGRNQTLTSISASIGYKVGPAVITLTGAREIRDSTQADYRFRANVFDLSVAIPLGVQAVPGDIAGTAF